MIAYNVGYWAVAPLSCTATGAITGGTSTTTCSSLIGLGYSGTGDYNPSLDMATLAGLVVAAIAFVVVLTLTLRQGKVAPSS